MRLVYGHVWAAYRSRCDGMLGSNGAINSGMITDGLRARMVIERATRCGSALQIGAAKHGNECYVPTHYNGLLALEIPIETP